MGEPSLNFDMTGLVPQAIFSDVLNYDNSVSHLRFNTFIFHFSNFSVKNVA